MRHSVTYTHDRRAADSSGKFANFGASLSLQDRDWRNGVFAGTVRERPAALRRLRRHRSRDVRLTTQPVIALTATLTLKAAMPGRTQLQFDEYRNWPIWSAGETYLTIS